MKKAISASIIVVSAVLAAGFLYLKSFIPDYDEQIAAPGLHGKVSIERNRFAVPTIEAQGLEDLYFAWGYVNAQDRMFQMEVNKRIGQGRISEFAGEEALPKDIFLRAVGFYEIAKRDAACLSPENRLLLQRFVDGINHYLETHKKPLYMTLLGIEVEPWTLADPIVVGMMLNWSLAYNMYNELMFHKVVQKIGPGKTKDLLALIPPDTPGIVAGNGGIELPDARFQATLAEFGTLLGGRSASNNWVLAAARTTFGGPLLASDPHVHDSKIPSDFYLIHLKSKDLEVAGGQVAGLPFVAFGYNRFFAWGLTNQGADVVDLFVETVDWGKKTFRYQGSDTPLSAREAVFQVKGKEPVKKTLYYAGHKPLLNDVFPEIKDPISLDWVGFGGIGCEGFFEMNLASNPKQWLEALNKIKMTPQNLVYADAQGNIGYRTLGALPARREGTGKFPASGEGTDHNWDGIADPDKNPSLMNPGKSYIATANNLVTRDFPYDMNPTVAPRYRYERIVHMIEDREKADVAYTRSMHADTQTELAAKVVPLMERYVQPGEDATMRKALDRVKSWDKRCRVDDPAPAIYNTFLVRFMYQTFEDELGPDLTSWYVGNRYLSLERFFFFLEGESAFFDDISTSQKEGPADIATRAFRETLELLAEATGKDDVDQWKWGEVHHIRFDHLLGKSKVLRRFVNRGPYPMAGDCETNLRASFTEVKPPFTATLASGIRLIVGFDPRPKALMSLITGQNEYFMSRHYTDLTDLWMAGEYFSVEDSEVKYRSILAPR